MSRPGRPPGASERKATILAAARALFAELGYEGTSIRAIAHHADVDPALVHHYFGTKDELLRCALRLPVDPEPLLTAAFGQPERAGEALVGRLVAAWDAPEVRNQLLALLRTATTNTDAAAILRDIVMRDALNGLAAHIDRPHPQLRAELIGTQLIGLALRRYLLAIEPLAHTPADRLATAVGPVIQHYFTEPDLI